MDIIALENFINYCDEMMITNEGAQIDAFKITGSRAYKDAKKLYKMACNNIEKDPEISIEQFTECIKIINELKDECNRIKDDSSKICKFFSYINPLLVLINNSESGGMLYTGHGLVKSHSIYTDKMSKKAPNHVAREVQESLNLLKKQCNNGIESARKQLKKSGIS